MGLFTGIGDFFRGAFGENEAEKKRRKQREAQEAAQRRATQQNQPKAQTFNAPKPQTPTFDQFFGQKSKPSPNVARPKPVLQQDKPTPKPDQYFTGITEGEGKNKTIFGKNAAWLLPKGNEKTHEVKADRNISTNIDKYVAQFDKLHPDYKKVLVNTAKEKAKKGDQAAINTLKALQDTGRLKGNISDFAEGANERLFGGLTRGALRTADLLLPGKNTWGLEREAKRQEAPRQFTEAGRAGETAGTVGKGLLDLATIVLPVTKIDQLTKASKVVKTLSDGSRLMRIGERLVRVIPGSAAGSAIDYTQQKGRGDDPNLAQSAGVGLGIDLAVGATPWGRVFGRGKGLISKIADETNPSAIKSMLGVDDNIATGLARETDPAIVKETLQRLAVDPNFRVNDEVRRRLEEEGITAVKRDPNDPYGASYKNNEITARDQQSLDTYVNHEVGHHIWKKRLTPEEKALFKGQGEASRQSVGRAGYTEDDVFSEDFSEYMNKALSGRLNEVPPEFRAVVAKYAKVSAKLAESVKKPAFVHKQNIQNVIKRENDNLNRYINENPQLTPQQLDAARDAAQKRTVELVEDLKAGRRAGLEAVEGQGKALDTTLDEQADVTSAVQAEQAAAGTPARGDVVPSAAANPETAANDVYERFNTEAGITSGSQDISYIDAQQQLEKMAGNRTMEDLTGRQTLRLPGVINEKTQGVVASGVTDVAGKGTGKLLTSQNPILNTIGQLMFGLNKKSTLSNQGKALVEQVRGRRGGLGNLGEQVVDNLETPIKQLDEPTQAAVKEKVFKAFELYNNGQIDESLALIKSFAPQERAYFDGIRQLNVLRNNLNRATLSLDKVDEYANGMHMPRLFDQATFAKEFDEDAVEAYAIGQNKTLDLNPTKRRKQLEDISEELREQMLRDPAKASAIRTEIALHNKGVSDYAASVSHLPGAVSDKPARGFLEIPDTTRYGNVAGKFVRKDLAEPMLSGDLRFKSQNYQAVNKLLDGYQASIFGKLENGLRKILTVYNPATRLGNRGANLTQGSLAGFNLPEMAVAQQHFINVLRKGGDEWTRLAKAFGAIDDNQALARFSGVVSEPKSGVLRRASDSYTDIDTAAKVAMFKWRIQKGATPEQAARFVNRALPNIGNSGEIYSFFSRLPVLGVPFRAIQPEVLRSVASSAGRNSLPFMVAMATYSTLQNMSWEGVDPEERKQIQERFGAGQTPFAGINKFLGDKGIPSDKILPSSWSFNAGALFGTDPETGDKRVVDVDPRRLMGIYSINLGGDSPADSVIDQVLKASPAPAPISFNDGNWEFAPQNIVGSRLFGAPFQAAIDRDFRGKSVQDPDLKTYNPDGTVSIARMNPETGKPEAKSDPRRMWEFITRSYLPQLNDAANIRDAKEGKENFYGQEMNLAQSIGRFFGLKGEEFSDKRLQKMDDQAEYHAEKEEIEKQVKGLSAASAEAYKRLTGYYKLGEKVPNEFEPGSTRYKKAPQYDFGEDKWKEYAANPDLYNLMVDKKQRENAKDGKPIQPEFDPRLSEAFRKQLIQNKMVAPGDDAELDQRMYSSPEWDYYQNLRDEYKAKSKGYYPDDGNDDFVDELVKHQDAKFPTKPDLLKQYSAAYKLYTDGKRDKPLFTDEMKALKEKYNQQTLNWTNTERRARGLPAITWDVWNNPTFGFDESPSGFGYGFGGGGGGRKAPEPYGNLLGELTNFSGSVNRLDPIEAAAMPQLAQLFARLQAGEGGSRAKPKLGASASGR